MTVKTHDERLTSSSACSGKRLIKKKYLEEVSKNVKSIIIFIIVQIVQIASLTIYIYVLNQRTDIGVDYKPVCSLLLTKHINFKRLCGNFPPLINIITVS